MRTSCLLSTKREVLKRSSLKAINYWNLHRSWCNLIRHQSSNAGKPIRNAQLHSRNSARKSLKSLLISSRPSTLAANVRYANCIWTSWSMRAMTLASRTWSCIKNARTSSFKSKLCVTARCENCTKRLISMCKRSRRLKTMGLRVCKRA